MRTYFTSDHHFNHKRILGYAGRPFANVEEMDAELIKRWNEVVQSDDRVFHLGDFVFGKVKDAAKYFSQLNGQIHVLANHWHHDKGWLPANVGPCDVYISRSAHQVIILPPMVVLEFKEFGTKKHPLAITLCHYQINRWERRHYGAWHLFGHSHNKTKGVGLSMDCGVDSQDFYPISLDKVAQIMQEREKNKTEQSCAALLACEYWKECDGIPKNHSDYCPAMSFDKNLKRQ